MVERLPDGTIDPRTLNPRVSAKTTKPSTLACPTENCISEKAGDKSTLSNNEFIDAICAMVPEGAHAAVCSKSGDPNTGSWIAHKIERDVPLPVSNNNYLNCSSFHLSEDGLFSVRKPQFAGLHFFLLDDLGTKVPENKFDDFEFSWKIETSPGNYQAGILLADPITDIKKVEQIQKSLISAEYSDPGASGVNRWARLPGAINGKEKYKVDGKPFQCRLVEWNPEKKYSSGEIIATLGLKLAPDEKTQPVTKVTAQAEVGYDSDDIFIPSATENVVITKLKENGLYKKDLGSGKHDITCPWCHEHTDQLDSGAAYFEPSDKYRYGAFSCLHSHHDQYRLNQLLKKLDLSHTQAMNQPIVRVVQGEIHRVVDTAERELARKGKHYQSGDLIVSITIDASTSNPTITPLNNSMLTRILAEIAIWEKYDRRMSKWIKCDPPSRYVSILNDSTEYEYLPPLSGLTRQPYFRESDGELVFKPEYDKQSGLFGVFDSDQFKIPEPTVENALKSLKSIEGLLSEFRFVSKVDKSAALAAIVTAVVRPSLPHSPAFHVKAPTSGSGKSYLCEIISYFAGPAGSANVSFPKTSEEATKVLLSVLLKQPAVIEFDDMDCDWLPHGVLNRALTAEHITDRILGLSKTATVSTRTLFLGSGNNVGPVRDLLRRVLTININPQCSTPTTIVYRGNPLESIRNNRGKYVSDVLTIVQAWKTAGSPRADVEPIATYNGLWADYCRHSLIWLGLPDPATTLLEQVKHDPDMEPLGRLLAVWYNHFGSTPTTVRKALELDSYYVDADDNSLMDAIREFPVEDRGRINRSKFGWILKKNANRIVNGLMFQKAEADGRTAWQVVKVKEH